MDNTRNKPYPELGYNWTIVRLNGEVADYFYGFNTRTGERLPARLTYGDALKDVEKREPGRRV